MNESHAWEGEFQISIDNVLLLPPSASFYTLLGGLRASTLLPALELVRVSNQGTLPVERL